MNNRELSTRLVCVYCAAALLFSLILISGIHSHAQQPWLIPLEEGGEPAVDLLYNGKKITPEELVQLRNQGFDISELSPLETPLWKNEIGTSGTPSDENIEVSNSDRVTYLSNVSSRSGNFRFVGTFHTQSEGSKNFTFFLSKKVHNILLRKTLLRKLGYYVPPIKRLSEVRVEFNHPGAKEAFLIKLAEATLGDPQRWIKDESEDYVVLQDLVVTNTLDEIYNLALGFVPRSIIAQRRVLNSLIVPFGLVHIPESVNLFEWKFGRVANKSWLIEFPEVIEFDGNLEDTKWISRRILKLTNEDIIDIAKSAGVPKPVELLIIEKLKSRIETLSETLELKQGPTSKPIYDISSGRDLVEGRLIKEDWPGYGSRFSFGNPESPLSNQELFALFRSKFYSNILSNLVNLFNTNFLQNKKIIDILKDNQLKVAKKQILKFLETGKASKVPLGVWAAPLFGANVISSRDIIIGRYLGTDNTLQLADSIGINLNLGAYIGVNGLPSHIQIGGGANGSITRMYTHLKPLLSVKAALKYPFKNAIVPLLKQKIANDINDVLNPEFKNLDDDERSKKLDEVFKNLDENFAVGESLIVSDTLGANFNIQAGYGFWDFVRAYTEFGTRQIVLSRLHIHRKSEGVIQVYKDLGNLRSFLLAAGINAKIPVVRLSINFNKGKARTKFYDVNIQNSEKLNPDLIRNLKAFRELLLTNSTEFLTTFQKPYTVQHDFTQRLGEFEFLLWRRSTLKSSDKIKVEHPEGSPRNFFQQILAKKKGVNIESLVTDVANSVIREVSGNKDIIINNRGSGRSEDTIGGSSLTRIITLEGEQFSEDKRESGKLLKDLYSRISYEWRGWKMSRKKVNKILDKINSRHDKPLYHANVLGTTKNLLFYNISLNYHLYEKGLRYLTHISESQIEQVFRKFNPSSEHIDMAIMAFNYQLDKFKKHRKENKIKKASSDLVKILNLAESYTSARGVEMLLGGRDNIYIQSQIMGFKEDNEGGDEIFHSDSIGEVGSRMFFGPLNQIKNFIGMTDSEFFGYWILWRQ